MPDGNILSPLGLLIPYGLYPLACYVWLVRLESHQYPGLTWPMALGAGPFLAAFIIELCLIMHPGPDQRWTIYAAVTGVGMSLLWMGRRTLPGLFRGRPGLSVFIGLHALTLLGFIWFIGGKHILDTWDPICYRLVADRIVDEGIINARRLLFEPTSNALLLVHPFHGPVYPLLMAMNRIFAGTGNAFYDMLPACWYLWACAWLAGGLAGGKSGWQGLRSWTAAALVFSSYWFIYWTIMVGQSLTVSAFGAFFCFASAYQATVATGSRQQTFFRWLLSGAALGLAMGVHRTDLVLPLVFLLFVHASGLAEDSGTRPIILAGILVSLLVFIPYGIHNPLSLDEANPVSNALTPYRATWRAAFEPPPIALAFRQFFTFRDGLILWDGALLTGILCLAHLPFKQHWRPREKRLILAVGLTIVFLAIVWADLSLVFMNLGMELIVRSTRYRNAMTPFLAFTVVAGLSWRLGDAGRPVMVRCIPALPTVLLGAAAMWVVLVATLWCFAPRHQLPFTRAAFHKSIETIRLGDEEVFFRRHPLAQKAVNALEADRDGFTLLDWMPLLLFTDGPVRNPWLNPGVFPLLDARDPMEAWTAAKALNIRRYLWRTHMGGNQLTSSTGLRHFLALNVSELIHDRGYIQIFRRRDRLLATIETLDMGVMLSAEAKTALGGSNTDTQFDLFHIHPTGPGDFELTWDFAPNRAVVLRLDQTTSSGNKRYFLLRSFKPYIAGPHRIRFLLKDGEQCRISAKVEKNTTWNAVRGVRLLRAPITTP